MKRSIVFYNQAISWIIFLLGMWLVVFKVFGNNLNFIPGDLGDTRLNNYILEHFFRRILGLDISYWSAPFFFPFTYTTVFSENFLGSAPFYALFRWIGLDRESAYQGWYVLGFVLNYGAATFVLTRLRLKALPAAVGAFFFTFGLPMLAQEGHGQLLYRFPVPLVSFLLWKFSQEPRLRTVFFLVLFTVWQFYLSMYLGVFLFLLLAALAVLSMIYLSSGSLWERLSFWPKKLKHAWLYSPLLERGLAAILISGSFFCLAYLFVLYTKVSNMYGFIRNWGEIEMMLPRLQSYFLADNSQMWRAFSGLISNIPVRHEHQLFPGITVLIFIILGLFWHFKSENREVAFIHFWALIFIVVLTININGFTLYRTLSWLPGLNGIRAVTRIQLVLMWPMALFIAYVIDALLARTHNRIVFYLFASLSVGLIVSESALYNHLSFSKVEARSRLSELRSFLPVSIPQDPILFVSNDNKEGTWYKTEIDAMLLAQDLDWPTLNGYSGYFPPGFSIENDCIQLPKRVNAYMNFAKITDPSYYFDIMKRVVPIEFTGCDPKWWSNYMAVTSNQGPLPPEMYKGITLRIVSIEMESGDENADAKIEIHNDTSYNLPVLSSTGNPFLLSWRFIDMKNNRPLSGFDPRRELDFDIPAKSSSVVKISIQLPTESGRYKLEVSAVQEIVAWFHLNGMPTALSNDVISIDGEKNIRISTMTESEKEP